MKKHNYLTAVFVLPLLFCQQLNSPTPSPDATQSGYFSLTFLEGLHKTSLASTTGTNTIDLGDLHSTTSYYFLLTNTGGHCITNIHLSVSDSSFVIFPTSIDSLIVGLGTQSLVPIIKLTALHGTGPQGLGSEPLMSPGIHQVQINVSGTTKQNNIDTTVSLIATAKINALVMDIDLHTELTTIDLTNPPVGYSDYQFDGFDVNYIREFIDSTDSIVTIVNKGNINIRLKSELVSNRSDSSSLIINVSDSANFIVRNGDEIIFRLDGNNTVCDPRKLPLQIDGKTYFVVWKF
jgi:hypothetical protein